MNEPLRNFVESLREELRQYGELLALLEAPEQLSSNPRVEPPEIVSAVVAQSNAIGAMHRERAQRQRELARSLRQRMDCSIADLIPLLPARYRPLVEALLEERKQLQQRVRQRACQHRDLLDGSLQIRPAVPSEATRPRDAVVEVLRKAIVNATTTFQRMGASSLSMVVKPDVNTQLTVHLKWQQARFEALAVLERGDLGVLDAQWPQLQHELAEHEVRLAPLVANGHHPAPPGSGLCSCHGDQRELAPSTEPAAPADTDNQTHRSAAAAIKAGNAR